jgi:superfamily I DNA and RNA helicase
METNFTADIAADAPAQRLYEMLQEGSRETGIDDAILYYQFPLYRDDELDGLAAAKLLLVSKNRGVWIFGSTYATDVGQVHSEVVRTEQVFSHLYARLLRSSRLRRTRTSINLPLHSVVFAPNCVPGHISGAEETTIIATQKHLHETLTVETWSPAAESYEETLSILEGAKGLIRPQKRDAPPPGVVTKGILASQIEAEISRFDQQQKRAALRHVDGPQRIRGLAGSGKTVVLAMKTALLHLRYPEARILYTFWTKSLYQHVRRLITRFYRQYDDKDPDWTKVSVLHGWGGASAEGVYHSAALAFGARPLTFTEASRGSSANPFGYACDQLLATTAVKPLFDYVLMDEGQDYPVSFIRLCAQLAENERFVIAYDELQNIFQPEAPTAAAIFGVNSDGTPQKDFGVDTVLHKCYRNPREILVCAHALGFGIYGNRIVQMLEGADHWTDVGYVVREGEFVAGSMTVLERPAENSLTSISASQSIDEIVLGKAFATPPEEVSWVVQSIVADIHSGLRPDDILVACVDDLNAKYYLSSIGDHLRTRAIEVNNVHFLSGTPDFQREGCVTLSTVHKSKGNEAFAVYVVGIESLFPNPSPRKRNILFAAMTRAKGWLRLSGIAPLANHCISELAAAKSNFPMLSFVYPNESELQVMRRDLEEVASRKLKMERLLEEVAGDLSTEEIEEILRRNANRTNKSARRKERKKDAE